MDYEVPDVKCEWQGCHNSIEFTRIGKRFCSEKCRKKDEKLRYRNRKSDAMKAEGLIKKPPTPKKYRRQELEEAHGIVKRKRTNGAQNARNNYFIDKYNLTAEEVDRRKAEHKRCEICGTDKPGGRGVWVIDHCHGSNKVRGILCHNCNCGLGLFRDNIVTLHNAIMYLERSS